MNLTKISRPCSHFGITIFEQEEGKRGIPLYQTWHIVNSITLYHITSHSILWLFLHVTGMLWSPNRTANQIRRSYKNDEFDWPFDQTITPNYITSIITSPLI